MDIVFSPVRKPGESWTERLQWLLITDGFGFRSPPSREAAARALAILAGYTGREVAEHLATVMVWNDAGAMSLLSSAGHVHLSVTNRRSKTLAVDLRPGA